MGRRRYRKRKEPEIPIEVLFDTAFHSGAAGTVLVIVLLISAGLCYANRNAMYGLLSIVGLLLLLGAGVIALITIIGLMRRSGGQILDAIGFFLFGLARAVSALFRGSSKPIPRSSIAPTPPPKRTYTPVNNLPTQTQTQVLPRRSTTPQASRAPSIPKARHDSPGSKTQRDARSPETSSILSKGEMAFYHPLRDIVAGRYEIHVKPSLADVLRYRNHPRWDVISKMHVDFLLCDVQTLQPRLAIELDDRSHHSAKRESTDRWKEDLLTEKRIPLLRQRCEAAYDVELLKKAIDAAIRS